MDVRGKSRNFELSLKLCYDLTFSLHFPVCSSLGKQRFSFIPLSLLQKIKIFIPEYIPEKLIVLVLVRVPCKVLRVAEFLTNHEAQCAGFMD